jgi:competence protein ComEA
MQYLLTLTSRKIIMKGNFTTHSFLVSLVLVFGSAFAIAQENSTGSLNQEPAATVELMTVNINEADAETIAEVLDGIGHSKAEAIVRYREDNGPFASAEELIEVKGVGEKTLARNEDKIRLE